MTTATTRRKGSGARRAEPGSGSSSPHRFLPPKGENWTGFCRSAKEAELAGSPPERVLERASHCRGAFAFPGGKIMHCDSPYHPGGSRNIVPRDLDQEIKEARRERALASGRSAVAVDRVTGKRTKERCRHGHEMDEANAGPRGTCRLCKRISSANFKRRKTGQPELPLTATLEDLQ